MPRASRRDFLTTSAGALLAVGAPRIGHAQTAVKVGTAVLGDYALAGPFIVADAKGLFKIEGLAAEYVPFRGGPDLVKAVVAGELLLGAAGSTDILVAREAGQPLKMVATHTEGNHFTLNVAPDVAAAADLKGKTIGVTRVGATTWVFARMFAKQQGWDPDRDVKIVGLGGLDGQLAAHKISSPLFSRDGQVSMQALGSMQDTLLEYEVIKKKLPLEEHVAREFFPVRL